jgi:CHASE2 domain-containing sensor protein
MQRLMRQYLEAESNNWEWRKQLAVRMMQRYLQNQQAAPGYTKKGRSPLAW